MVFHALLEKHLLSTATDRGVCSWGIVLGPGGQKEACDRKILHILHCVGKHTQGKGNGLKETLYPLIKSISALV